MRSSIARRFEIAASSCLTSAVAACVSSAGAALAQRLIEHVGDAARQRVARLRHELQQARAEAVDDLVQLGADQRRHAIDRQRPLLLRLRLDLGGDAPAQHERQHRRRQRQHAAHQRVDEQEHRRAERAEREHRRVVLQRVDLDLDLRLATGRARSTTPPATSRMFSLATWITCLGQPLQLGGDPLALGLGPRLPGVLHEERQVACGCRSRRRSRGRRPARSRSSAVKSARSWRTRAFSAAVSARTVSAALSSTFLPECSRSCARAIRSSSSGTGSSSERRWIARLWRMNADSRVASASALSSSSRRRSLRDRRAQRRDERVQPRPGPIARQRALRRHREDRRLGHDRRRGACARSAASRPAPPRRAGRPSRPRRSADRASSAGCAPPGTAAPTRSGSASRPAGTPPRRRAAGSRR